MKGYVHCGAIKVPTVFIQEWDSNRQVNPLSEITNASHWASADVSIFFCRNKRKNNKT